jgi:hypothetical protein
VSDIEVVVAGAGVAVANVDDRGRAPPLEVIVGEGRGGTLSTLVRGL